MKLIYKIQIVRDIKTGIFYNPDEMLARLMDQCKDVFIRLKYR